MLLKGYPCRLFICRLNKALKRLGTIYFRTAASAQALFRIAVDHNRKIFETGLGQDALD